jgi:hypothetical protein
METAREKGFSPIDFRICVIPRNYISLECLEICTYVGKWNERTQCHINRYGLSVNVQSLLLTHFSSIFLRLIAPKTMDLFSNYHSPHPLSKYDYEAILLLFFNELLKYFQLIAHDADKFFKNDV